MRKQHKLNAAHPDRRPDGQARCVDGVMLVWHEKGRTVSEISGSYRNMGAFWCRGRVTARVLAREYDKECRDNE